MGCKNVSKGSYGRLPADRLKMSAMVSKARDYNHMIARDLFRQLEHQTNLGIVPALSLHPFR